MDSIKKYSIINNNNLNQKFYFSSLLEEAYNNKLLCESDLEKIKMQCLELLANKIENFNDDKSSSVRVEIAEEIMESNLYTISVYLKSLNSPDDAVKLLIENNISDIYKNGRKCIKSKINASKFLRHKILDTLLKTENFTYNSTIVDGINGFFKIYDADFKADEIPITADYPICNTAKNLVGIEFIEKYLESIYYENLFCKYFSKESIDNLLLGYNEEYSDLIFNIFEQVLTCSLGCILADANPLDLQLSIIQVEHIYTSLFRKTKDEIKITLLLTFDELLKKLNITNANLREYIKVALDKITSRIFHAIEIDKLEGVFIQSKLPKTISTLYFSLGNKIDDEKYNYILNEINQCRFSTDKLDIIKNDIKSLADLEDLFCDAIFTTKEINSILEQLSTIEISALAKRHPYNIETYESDLSKSEILLRQCLYKYISSLLPEKQLLIKETSDIINFD